MTFFTMSGQEHVNHINLQKGVLKIVSETTSLLVPIISFLVGEITFCLL